MNTIFHCSPPLSFPPFTFSLLIHAIFASYAPATFYIKVLQGIKWYPETKDITFDHLHISVNCGAMCLLPQHGYLLPKQNLSLSLSPSLYFWLFAFFIHTLPHCPILSCTNTIQVHTHPHTLTFLEHSDCPLTLSFIHILVHSHIL